MSEKERDELTGLQYLSQVRPEAMEHLLSFFRESSRHLDAKTRFLISVVTKVVNFSARGLRQYIPRAMREGASRDEVIDAILCAYPAAGLTKVVDAIDVLRSLDLSEFESEEKEEEEEEWIDFPDSEEEVGPGWVSVLKLDRLPPGESKKVSVKGEEIALFNADGQIRAVINTCPHLGAHLSDGALEGEVLTCPWHSWQFNLETGACLNQPGRTVKTYQVRIEGEEIQLLID